MSIPLRNFGKTGVQVSALGLGGHHLGGAKDEKTALIRGRKVMEHAFASERTPVGVKFPPGYLSVGDSAKLLMAGGDSSSSGRLVSAMLSNEIDEKLEPLRLTLGLTGNVVLDNSVFPTGARHGEYFAVIELASRLGSAFTGQVLLGSQQFFWRG